MDLIGALKRPFTDWKKLLVGSAFYMVPYLNLITTFFATGYTLEAAKNTIGNNSTLPEWRNWGELFYNGIISAVVGLVYMIPVIILFLILGLGREVLTLVEGGNPLAILSGSGPLLLVVMALAIVIAYITPYAVLLWIDMDSFKEAFSIKHVFSNAFTMTYFTAWFAGLVYSLVFGVLITVINYYIAFTVVIPVLLLGFYRFISGVTIMTLLGEAFRKLK